MATPWILFQPLDRVLAAGPRAAERSAVSAARILALGSVVGPLIGSGNLLVKGALHPGLGTVVYGAVMATLLVQGVVLALLRRPGERILTVVVLTNYLLYVTIATCVVDAPTLASPIMLMFSVVASAMLLNRRAFLVSCAMTPLAVAIGLAGGWSSTPMLLHLQIGAQSAMLLSAMVAFYWLRRRAERLLAIVQQAADTDHLTHLLNRRGLTSRVKELPAGTPLVLMAVDLDHFKVINDLHGHAVGDELLVAVTASLERAAPPGTLIARTGGEEFVVSAPAGTEAEAADVARALHTAVRSEAGPVQVTCSAGFLHVVVPGPGTDVAAWLWQGVAAADQALYAAKREGRDRVVQVRRGQPRSAELV